MFFGNKVLLAVLICLFTVMNGIAEASEGHASEYTVSTGWVNACGVVTDQADAETLLIEFAACGYDHAGHLWIPDWNSLSGYEGWLVYTGPYDSAEDASIAACRLLWKYPDIYSILVSDDPVRMTASPAPGNLADLTGLMPPTQNFMHQSTVPESWGTEWKTHGSGEEWELPVQITSIPPGWIIDEWEDIYAGTIELRGFAEPFDATGEYERVSAFIREGALVLDVSVIESPGEYILLHSLPDPDDRRGDMDFWVAVRSGTLEYGLRVRSFYGEMSNSWMNIPEEARESFIPRAVDSRQEAIGYLLERLLEDGVYGADTIENISFGFEYLDGFPESAWRDYYDIAIREVHRPGGEGDPNTAPILDRFRVYSRGGEILWWNPVFGSLLPYSELFFFKYEYH
ncbi:MAG: hypothetical protein KAW14_00675 [Candidatus Aegiribacteria sp.]|nr:hypothetical protein [Candidatus Aegiribacteria sp.]